jgi:transcriptional regulator with XRE-family HTH domain
MPSLPPSDPLLRRLGENLRAIREREGIDLATLASRADVGIELIRELEHFGDQVPKIATVLRLAGALGVDPGELVAGVRWVPIEIVRERGHFEVTEDPALAAQVAALRAAATGRARSA